MIRTVSKWVDRYFGRGEFAITVPVMDGAFKPNDEIDRFAVVDTFDAPQDIASGPGFLLVADGRRLLRLEGSDTPREIARFDDVVTAVTVLKDDGIAVAVGGREIRLVGGAFGGTTLRTDGYTPLHAVNALAADGAGRLVVTDASVDNPVDRWNFDLMELRRSGRVFRFDLAGETVELLADGLGHPFGVAVVDQGSLLVSEAWKHHVLNVGALGNTTPVLDNLPGYPSRLVPASSGGFWLTVFLARTLLVEFVLREHAYRKRMITEVDPRYWIAPLLLSGQSHLEPMQRAGVKQMGILKPWSPPRSYGLVVRLDADFQPLYTLHSRIGGADYHGVTAAAEHDGKLYLLARGPRRLLAANLSVVEKEPA